MPARVSMQLLSVAHGVFEIRLHRISKVEMGQWLGGCTGRRGMPQEAKDKPSLGQRKNEKEKSQIQVLMLESKGV